MTYCLRHCFSRIKTDNNEFVIRKTHNSVTSCDYESALLVNSVTVWN